MGYSKDPALYPEEFQELYRRALSEDVRIELGYAQQAHTLRHQLHAYRRAVEGAKKPGWSDLRQVQIQIQGSKLIMRKNPALDILQEMVGKPKGPTEDELDAYLRQMEKGEQDE